MYRISLSETNILEFDREKEGESSLHSRVKWKKKR